MNKQENIENTTLEQSQTIENQASEAANELHAETTARLDAEEDDADELKLAQDAYQELQEKYVRLYADFDNYRKRTQRDQLETIKSASSDLIRQILPVLDDFDRAKQAEKFSEGVLMVYEKLKKTLASKGLKPMDTHEQPFDAEFHEAITEINAPDEKLKGKIVDTIEKGYFLNDKILRHAKVVVGK
jgi:molecular chaperone GrpE